jgi:hypothetical protein
MTEKLATFWSQEFSQLLYIKYQLLCDCGTPTSRRYSGSIVTRGNANIDYQYSSVVIQILHGTVLIFNIVT